LIGSEVTADLEKNKPEETSKALQFLEADASSPLRLSRNTINRKSPKLWELRAFYFISARIKFKR
jgi:hypothetical protein